MSAAKNAASSASEIDVLQTCRRCGKCCSEGGAVLHIQDLESVQRGLIPRTSLITIRKGEPVHHPEVNGLRPASTELLKLAGSGGSWQCCFYREGSGCSIYETRPYACTMLECWNTEKILAIIEKDTLSRKDLVGEDDAVWPLIAEHEKQFPCDGLIEILQGKQGVSQTVRCKWEELVQKDIAFRNQVVGRLKISVQDELFYFGRPLFQLLQQLGVRVTEQGGTLRLHW